jgi:phenylalanyl-tRNA synthetase beta chain
MKVPISWLKDYVDFTLPVNELAERLTLAGLETERIERIGVEGAELPWDPEKVVTAQVLEVKPHPNADRLTLATVDYGRSGPYTVVTGAPNLKVGDRGQKVAFALEGAALYDGHQPGRVPMTLKGRAIRGVYNDAMVLSEKELGLSEAHEGILILPDDAPVGVPLADYLGDVILDLDLTPNLARCFSMLGVGREVAALTGQALRYPSSEMVAAGAPVEGQVDILIEDATLCPRYSATIIRDVRIGPSPGWMQQRLERAGMRPINNIVDITNYVMLEWGQPLHAFDYDKLVARAGGGKPTIIVRSAQPDEELKTLDGVVRRLSTNDLLITDSAGPIAIAGVMGGAETEVDETTRNILLESANFHFISIRRTTAAQRLPSEASTRFGRGVHPALARPAVQRASELMRTLAGGTIAQGVADAYPAPPPPVVIVLRPAEVKRILGLTIPVEEIVRSLRALEFDCRVGAEAEDEGGEYEAPPIPEFNPIIRVTVPQHRLDVEGPHDLIEEVARIYGYDRIPLTHMADELPPQRTNWPLVTEERTRDLLVKAGLQEVITYALTTPEREALLMTTASRDGRPLRAMDDTVLAAAGPYVAIANPISAERVVMRHTLLAGVLDVLARNLRHHDRVALFEIGSVYLCPSPMSRASTEDSSEAALPDEPRRLTIVMSGPRELESWSEGETQAARPLADFYDLKGVVEALVAGLHLPDASYTPGEHASFHPGRVAALRIAGEDVGVLGELHPLVRAAFDLPDQPVLAAELDLERLLAHVPTRYNVEDVPRYPQIGEDIAVVVDEATPAIAVRDVITAAGGDLLRRVELFDLYRGGAVPAGKKSLAYRLTYQADDRTLTDIEVATLRARIVKRLAQDLGASLR